MTSALYSIYKIRDRETNETHERESRRQGHQLSIALLEESKSMIWHYVTGGYVHTSSVESFSHDSTERVLTVITRNTVYTFKKVWSQ